MYYDTEVSLTPEENADTSTHIEETNNVPHSNIPANMIQLNDSVMVSTVTDDVTTLTGTENNQLASLPDIAEEENQDETIQNLDHNMESTMNTSHDESNHHDEQQNIEQEPVDTMVNTTLDDEMNTKYGS